MSGISPARPAPAAVAAAPNGGRKTKADHPAVPITADELAETAAACRDAGAAMIHLHVRGRDGAPTLDAEALAEASAAIRRAVGDSLVIQVSTESLGRFSPAEQMAAVAASRPEAASLAVREFAPSAADEAAFAAFLAEMRTWDTLPQFIVYAPEDLARLDALIAAGVVPWADPPVLFVLGRHARGQISAPADLLAFLAPGQRRPGHWMVCAFGPREIACAATAAALGGHARVGFENNVLLPDGRTAADNAALVAATVAAIGALGLVPETADGLRASWRRCLDGSRPLSSRGPAPMS